MNNNFVKIAISILESKNYSQKVTAELNKSTGKMKALLVKTCKNMFELRRLVPPLLLRWAKNYLNTLGTARRNLDITPSQQ